MDISETKTLLIRIKEPSREMLWHFTNMKFVFFLWCLWRHLIGQQKLLSVVCECVYYLTRAPKLTSIDVGYDVNPLPSHEWWYALVIWATNKIHMNGNRTIVSDVKEMLNFWMLHSKQIQFSCILLIKNIYFNKNHLRKKCAVWQRS